MNCPILTALLPSQQALKVDREVEIELTTKSGANPAHVRYNVTAGQYRPNSQHGLLLDLLTLPSRIIHKDFLLAMSKPALQLAKHSFLKTKCGGPTTANLEGSPQSIAKYLYCNFCS